MPRGGLSNRALPQSQQIQRGGKARTAHVALSKCGLQAEVDSQKASLYDKFCNDNIESFTSTLSKVLHKTARGFFGDNVFPRKDFISPH